MNPAEWQWSCACCGRQRQGIPDFAYDAPIHHHWALAGEPGFRVVSRNSDTCVMEISGERCHFVRGVLALPVQGADRNFGFGAWSTLGAESFRRYSASFSDPRQSRVGPMFGYLANRLPEYPDTLNLRLDVLPQDGGLRPLLRLRPDQPDHPLMRDQADGLTADRLAGLLSRLLPCDGQV